MNDEIFEPIIHTSVSQEEIRNHILWIANLSDGTQVFHKQGRRSWLELKSWLKENPDIHITGLCFRFRDHFECFPAEQDGYFFSLGSQCFAGESTQQLQIGGYVKDGIIYRKKYLTPELILAEPNPVDSYPVDHEKMQLGLILNGKNIQE